jgi:3-methyladenine DNA glycosylase AlkD
LTGNQNLIKFIEIPQLEKQMDFEEVITLLASLGSEQTRKTYTNHGVKGVQFGVSFANLDKLAKSLRKDKGVDRNALPGELWASGNHDARMLAIKIADPGRIEPGVIDVWAQDLDNYIVCDGLSGLVCQAPFAIEKMKAWVDEPGEWISAAGWNLLGCLAMKENELGDEFFSPYLAQIQSQIHNRPNRTRYAMNNALIAIGIRNHTVEQQALQVAREVGEANVDHGKTSCKTPLASDYIQKSWEHKEKKAGVRG